jgi:hypothetical protein
MKTTFKCFVCKETKTHEDDLTTGYGRDKHNHKICFDCCGKRDAETLRTLRTGQKTAMYLVGDKQITNWPGTLKIDVSRVRKGNHNMAGKRIDVWFAFSGFNYHGVTYGDNTQICYINKVN